MIEERTNVSIELKLKKECFKVDDRQSGRFD